MTKRTPIPAWLRLTVMERDHWRCRYCHDTQGPFHLDHVIPWSKGGADSADNLVTACVPCNLAKRCTLWTVPPVAQEVTLTPRRESIRAALERRVTLEKVASERGHVATWRPCSRKTVFWKCSCGVLGKFPTAQKRGLPPTVQWHLMDAIGVMIEAEESPLMLDEVPVQR